jgi:hypothetical protein
MAVLILRKSFDFERKGILGQTPRGKPDLLMLKSRQDFSFHIPNRQNICQDAPSLVTKKRGGAGKVF